MTIWEHSNRRDGSLKETYTSKAPDALKSGGLLRSSLLAVVPVLTAPAFLEQRESKLSRASRTRSVRSTRRPLSVPPNRAVAGNEPSPLSKRVGRGSWRQPSSSGAATDRSSLSTVDRLLASDPVLQVARLEILPNALAALFPGIVADARVGPCLPQLRG